MRAGGHPDDHDRHRCGESYGGCVRGSGPAGAGGRDGLDDVGGVDDLDGLDDVDGFDDLDGLDDDGDGGEGGWLSDELLEAEMRWVELTRRVEAAVGERPAPPGHVVFRRQVDALWQRSQFAATSTSSRAAALVGAKDPGFAVVTAYPRQGAERGAGPISHPGVCGGVLATHVEFVPGCVACETTMDAAAALVWWGRADAPDVPRLAPACPTHAVVGGTWRTGRGEAARVLARVGLADVAAFVGVPLRWVPADEAAAVTQLWRDLGLADS